MGYMVWYGLISMFHEVTLMQKREGRKKYRVTKFRADSKYKRSGIHCIMLGRGTLRKGYFKGLLSFFFSRVSVSKIGDYPNKLWALIPQLSPILVRLLTLSFSSNFPIQDQSEQSVCTQVCNKYWYPFLTDTDSSWYPGVSRIEVRIYYVWSPKAMG